MTAKFNPAMELNNCDKGEDSLSTREVKIQLSWQLKALLAGRVPLPTSRPKRKVHEIEIPESGEDSSISGKDERSAASSESPHSENEKKSIIAVHVVSISRAEVNRVMRWILISRRLRDQNSTTSELQGSSGSMRRFTR
jgi:hypothetical protein